MHKVFFNQLIKIICYIVCCIPGLAHARLVVQPIRIEIHESKKIGELNITNDSDEDKMFQLEKLEPINATESEYIPTDDFIATPVIFKLKARQSQTIRVAKKSRKQGKAQKASARAQVPAALAQKNIYYLHIRGLPSKVVGGDTGVNFTTSFLLPVSIADNMKGKPKAKPEIPNT